VFFHHRQTQIAKYFIFFADCGGAGNLGSKLPGLAGYKDSFPGGALGP
jgi:hypothetical protein